VVAVIRSARLELVSFSARAMRAVLSGDFATAETELGAAVPRALKERLGELFEARLAEVDADPSLVPWVARAIVLTDRKGVRRVVGSVGFHGAPNDSGQVEIGYHVEPAYRRRGFATEAVRALVDWAARERDVRRFRASVAPSNAPSLAIMSRLGFRQTGVRWDVIDGEQLTFELERPEDDARPVR
jgi:[ribosomal protein S5]-alanine N-acetyltransferase